MGIASCEEVTRKLSFCVEDGMPVMGSRRDLKCAMVHDGFTRRSDCAFEDLMRRGMSAAAPENCDVVMA